MPYAELHCLSNFSFLQGASHPEELVAAAHAQGYRALAITDECSLAGVVKAYIAARELPLQLIVGSTLRLEDGRTLVALAPSRKAYAELSGLITLARRRAGKGDYRLAWKDLPHNLRHCLLIWLAQHHEPLLDQQAGELQAAFAGRCWVGIRQLCRGDDPEHLQRLLALSEQHALPAVAVGSVLMHSASRKPLQDALNAIRHNTSVEQLGLRLEPNAEQHLRALPELQRRYPATLLQESLRIARRCHFCLSELQYDYPPEVVPPGLDAGDYLRHLVLEGARQRWSGEVSPRWQAQIDHELALIRELNYEHYFLTVYDIVAFARARGILCQGRGSAANSVVCYCLFITEVPPDRVSLLFERFISRERASEPPDIDVDFEHERREEVIQYIYKKYSRERAALAATLICYKPRSAVRDIGKALGLDAGFIQQLSGSLAWWDRRNELEQRCREQGMPANSPLIRLFARLVLEIQGFPRHLSQHVGGFVITRSPISHLVPVENAAMPERTVIQWDKESLEALGLLKVDILALGMLSAIRKCLQLIGRHQGRQLTMQTILREEDPAVYDMLCRADCVGVFQVESRAQMAMLPRLRPRNYYDLVVQVAIVRPGPIQGNMVHPYLRQRERQRAGQPLEVLSDDSAVQAVLTRTHGIPIFQEQVIKLAMVAAGFSPGEADRLRRAMGSWGKNGDLDGFRHRLVAGMLERGHDAAFAERLFEQMRGFGAYGFPESHAASFALLVYVSAWLKCHHPAAFYCALLNSQPMGFYSPSQLIQDARRHGIRVRPVDVCHSDWDHSLEPGPDTGPALRLGLRLVKHLGPQAAARLLAARSSQPFASQPDLHRRAGLTRAELQALVEADALSGLSGHRRQAHWRALVIDPSEDAAGGEADDGVALAPADAVAELSADYAATGLSLRGHPMSLLRERHALFRRCKSHAELATLNHGRFVRIAGVVTGRQRPGSASGVVFLTLEDETGNTTVVVWKDLQARYREALLTSRLLLVKGVLEKNRAHSDTAVIHVIAGELIDCSDHWRELAVKSRDFH